MWLGGRVLRLLLWMLGIGAGLILVVFFLSMSEAEPTKADVKAAEQASQEKFITTADHQYAMQDVGVTYSIDLVRVSALMASATPERVDGFERILDEHLNSLTGNTLLDVWKVTEAHYSTFSSWEMSGRHPNYVNCFAMTSFAMLETAGAQCWGRDEYTTRDVTDALHVAVAEYWFVDIDRLTGELEVVDAILYL